MDRRAFLQTATAAALATSLPDSANAEYARAASTAPTHSKCSPDGVRDAVLAAFHGNADGIILSRKYSDMKLSDLQGTRTALHQLHLPT